VNIFLLLSSILVINRNAIITKILFCLGCCLCHCNPWSCSLRFYTIVSCLSLFQSNYTWCRKSISMVSEYFSQNRIYQSNCLNWYNMKFEITPEKEWAFEIHLKPFQFSYLFWYSESLRYLITSLNKTDEKKH